MSKEFESLKIYDNFMFGAVMKNPEKCKPVLECVLGIKIRKITYPELEKAINVTYESRSIRLDAYVEDDANTVYNIEMQATDRKNLPKRIRYYQGMIDMNILEKSDSFNRLKKSYVIFICNYDEFGLGRHVYTFEKQCKEVPGLLLGDDTTVIILNSKGTEDDVNDEVKGLLDYIAGEEPRSNLAKSLDEEVEKVKANEKWRREYMTMNMMIREQKDIAVYSKVISLVKKKLGVMSSEEMSDCFDVNINVVNTIIDNLDMDEEELAEMLFDLED